MIKLRVTDTQLMNDAIEHSKRICNNPVKESYETVVIVFDKNIKCHYVLRRFFGLESDFRYNRILFNTVYDFIKVDRND